MKRLLLSGTASMLCCGLASAADLPARQSPPAFVAPALAVYDWTGFYAGGNVGGAFTTRDNESTIPNDPRVTQGQINAGTVLPNFVLHQAGVTAGAQIGYNHEFAGGIVAGIEADAAYTDLDKSSQYVGVASVTSNYHQSLDYLGTVRGRLGYAFDRALIYGTGGFAYGQTHFSQSIVAGNANNLLIWGGNQSSLQTGFAVGGGVEYALPVRSILNPFNASAVTLRAEYLYYDLGSRNVNLVGGAGAPYYFTDAHRTAGNIVRGAINYKFDFGGQPVPVVAKY